MITVLVADDEALVRQSIRLVLGTDEEIEVVAEAADGVEAVLAARMCRPHVAILDIRMPYADGLTTTRELLMLPRAPRIIILTSYTLDEYMYAALHAGADGFLIKDVSPQELVSAVKVVARGEAIISPRMTKALIRRYTPSPGPSAAPSDTTDRLRALPEEQQAILSLLAQGLSNAEIGSTLGLTESQVKVQVSRILRVLRLSNRVQAAILAYSAGLSKEGDSTHK